MSDKLHIEAQNYSDFMVANQVYSDYDTYLGQNIHYSDIDKGNDAILKAIDEWYSEIDYYNFSDPVYNYGNRDFVHMIWKNSDKFGIGVSTSENFGTVVFSLFNHIGNYNDRLDLLNNIQKQTLSSSIVSLNVFIILLSAMSYFI